MKPERIPAAIVRCSSAVLVASAALVAGSSASAQDRDAGRPPSFVHIIPRVGLIAPDAYMYEQYANFSGDGPVEWTNGNLGRALILGLGCEVGWPDGAVRIRGEVVRSFGGWLFAAHSVVVPRQLFEPPRVQTTWLDVPTAVTMVSVQLVLPTRLTLFHGEPYVLAGVAGKRYDFGDPTPANAVDAILPSGGTTWGADVGAGITLPILGLTLDIQGRDAVNKYWGKTEHDLVFTTGIVWRVR